MVRGEKTDSMKKQSTIIIVRNMFEDLQKKTLIIVNTYQSYLCHQDKLLKYKILFDIK